MRQIPASGINLFQLIYILIREYEEKAKKPCLNLSLGNPDLIPVAEILKLKSKYQLKSDYDLHTYAEDKNLEKFCEGLVRNFTGVQIEKFPQLRATPIAGIKTATAILPLACGLHLKGRENFTVVTHLPAYDVMGTWESQYLGAKRVVWPLLSSNQMKMEVADLKAALETAKIKKPDLIFVIRPGNPASQGATQSEWKDLIEFCLQSGIRLVNDGAYTTLTESGSKNAHIPLAQVAKDYPDLEWMELLSVSKAFSDPGQRLGVALGSKDFIEDFILIKGNTDSGPNPIGMSAYGELFQDEEKTQTILKDLYTIYKKRLGYLVSRLKSIGLVPACDTSSGFFTLWKTPDHAFGIDLNKKSKLDSIPKAELFNRLTIENTGIVGVHFTGPADDLGTKESFIRYAVCTDVLDPKFQERFEAQIATIKPHYLN
jgi:aspartate/methionine/tyrosine aminotransferase